MSIEIATLAEIGPEACESLWARLFPRLAPSRLRDLLECDPFHEPWQTRVALLSGRLVGHVRLRLRPMAWPVKTTWLGGVELLAVSPEGSQGDVVARLVDDAVDALESRGVTLAYMHAGRFGGLCRNRGWMQLRESASLLPVRHGQLATDTRYMTRSVGFRLDLAGLTCAYEETNAERWGTILRPEAYWRRWVRAVAGVSDSPRTMPNLVVADDDGLVAAYAIVTGGPGPRQVAVLEMCCRQGAEDALLPLMDAVMNLARSNDCTSIVYYAPDDHPIHQQLGAARAMTMQIEHGEALWRVVRSTGPQRRSATLSGLLRSLARSRSRRAEHRTPYIWMTDRAQLVDAVETRPRAGVPA